MRAGFSFRLRVAGLLILTLLTVTLFSACGSNGASGSLHQVIIGLTYIPNIQFAPFYVADSLGYYRDAGVSVTLQHHSVNEAEFGAIASGKEDVVFGGGDEMLQARASKIPLVYVANVYAKYPVALMVPASSSIHTAADLRGHTIGVPGMYGETYFGLLALLQSNKVDAVMGYLNNEAIQFKQANFAVRTLALSDVVQPLPLISNGLGALQSELDAHPGDIKAVIAATLRGVQYVIANPQKALDISKTYVPGLRDSKNAANALAVLQATIPLWQSTGQPGYNDPAIWQAMATFMPAYGLLPGSVDVTQAYSNSYLPQD